MKDVAVSPGDELLLRLSQAREGREADAGRIADLTEAAGSDVWEVLRAQRLIGVFGHRLRALVPDVLDDTLLERLVAYETLAQNRAAAHEIVLHGVLDSLERAGIPSLALKGPRLSEMIHGDIGRRVSGDLDVLVSADRLQDAVRIVERLGWQRPLDPLDRSGRPLLHLAMAHPNGLPPVELHWRVHWYEERFAQDALGRSEGAPTRRALRRSDELVFLLLFAARDAFSGLRLTVDTVAWLDRFGHEVWDEVPAIVDAHPALERVLSISTRQVRRIAYPNEPAQAGRRGVRELSAAHLVDPLLRMTAKQRQAERGLFDILAAPSDQTGACIRRQVFPPDDILRMRAAVAGGGPTRTPHHAARTVRRYLLAPLVRLRRRSLPATPAG